MSALPPVLVVDDEKNMRLSLQTVLGDEGYQVKAVERAEAGETARPDSTSGRALSSTIAGAGEV